MLSWLFGCWHRWTRWEPARLQVTILGGWFGTTHEDGQSRHCEKCGKEQLRLLSHK